MQKYARKDKNEKNINELKVKTQKWYYVFWTGVLEDY